MVISHVLLSFDTKKNNNKKKENFLVMDMGRYWLKSKIHNPHYKWQKKTEKTQVVGKGEVLVAFRFLRTFLNQVI